MESKDAYWASLDTPKKAVLDMLKSLARLDGLSANELNGMADYIVAGLRNAGHLKDGQ